MKVLAPGKLILSGEHAVVYGKPALAMAVNRYVTAITFPQEEKLISFDLLDLKYASGLTMQSLDQLKNRIKEKYRRFIHGDFKIRDVLQKPFELAQFAFSLCLDFLNIKLTQGIQVHIQSSIPMGCGMGSSAATILSIMHAIVHHFGLKVTQETLLHWGLEAENMQHGISSGLDLKLSLYGGCRYLKDDHVYVRPLPTIPFFLVNTGIPETSTGECVTKVSRIFNQSSIANDFAAITESMDAALTNNQDTFKQAIKANHQLLVRIGVVPERVQTFIANIEKRGGAAKICGSGAIAGHKAGVVLIVMPNECELKTLCQSYQYDMLPIQGEPRGVYVI